MLPIPGSSRAGSSRAGSGGIGGLGWQVDHDRDRNVAHRPGPRSRGHRGVRVGLPHLTGGGRPHVEEARLDPPHRVPVPSA